MAFIENVGGFVILVLLAYAVVRVASFAYFKTKLEHFRSVKKEAEGNKKDGV